MHKKRKTGAKVKAWHKKKKYNMGRQPSMTKIGPKRVRQVRVRGGNIKFRALRLEAGNFSWGSEGTTRKTRILDVVYNASNNELVRTKTLVKNAIVLIDSAPFRLWYEQHYGVQLGRKKATEDGEEEEETKRSNHLQRKLSRRQEGRVIDPTLADQFNTGRLMACIASRPGQSGRCDGYILEGPELQFYQRKIHAKKKGH